MEAGDEPSRRALVIRAAVVALAAAAAVASCVTVAVIWLLLTQPAVVADAFGHRGVVAVAAMLLEVAAAALRNLLTLL